MEEIIKILRGEKETTEYARPAENLKRRQLRRLKDYALQKQKWIEYYNSIGFFLSKGGENEVYANDDAYVYKYNNFEFAGDDILNFFQRIYIHNYLFPDVAYDLIGFGKNSKSEISAIIKQPYIEVEREAHSQEIKSYMINYGFELDDQSSFRNEDYYIFDAVPHNVLMGIDKRLYFIDTQIKLITQNLA